LARSQVLIAGGVHQRSLPDGVRGIDVEPRVDKQPDCFGIVPGGSGEQGGLLGVVDGFDIGALGDEQPDGWGRRVAQCRYMQRGASRSGYCVHIGSVRHQDAHLPNVGS
jgi:hypothetical protein